MRIVIDLKRGEVGQVVLNNLYKHTALQTSFGIILLAIVDNRPKVLKLVELVKLFIEFRRDVVRRRTDLRAAQGRRARPYPRRVRHRARQPRRRHRAHQSLGEARRRRARR